LRNDSKNINKCFAVRVGESKQASTGVGHEHCKQNVTGMKLSRSIFSSRRVKKFGLSLVKDLRLAI